MLGVYICEDNPEEQKKISDFIKKHIVMQNLDMELVLATENPYCLLSEIRDTSIVGIYFLDVDLKSQINGIELAAEIRKLDPRGFIIFITTHDELCPLTFKHKVEAMDYISKDDFTSLNRRIIDCLENALNLYHSSTNKIHKIFCIKIGMQTFSIPMDDVYFFESAGKPHKVIAHLNSGIQEFYESMEKLARQADSRFFRCHRSYLVNIDHIVAVDRSNLLLKLDNGKSCPISARKLRSMNKDSKDNAADCGGIAEKRKNTKKRK